MQLHTDFSYWSETCLTSVADLPDPLELLSKSNPSSVVKVAHTRLLCGICRSRRKHMQNAQTVEGTYQHYSNKERAEIAKRATDLA